MWPEVLGRTDRVREKRFSEHVPKHALQNLLALNGMSLLRPRRCS